MDTIVSIVKERVKEHPDRPILRYKEDAIYKDITWGQLGRKVRLLGSFLLDIGIKINDRVAIFSENRPEWVYADLAILSTGGITVPIYATESAKNIEYLLNDSEAEVIFVSGTDRYQRVLSIARNTKIKKIILFKGIESIDPIATEFEEALERGEEKLDLYSKVLDERAKAIDGESLVTIIYTSGSTGMPKGVCLTNRNFITNCRTAVDLINITEKDRYLSFLPLSHVFERMAGYYAHLIQGSQIAYAGSRDTILQDAKSISPTLMYGVPRFFEKIYSTILNNAVKSSPLKKNLFFWAYRVGRACMYRRLKKKDIPLYLRLSKRFVTDPIAKKLKKMFGKSLRFFVSGGAPLSKEVAYFFLSFDILILEGYGLTETSPVIAVNTTSNYRIGTVGRPIPGIEVRISHDGEIMVKGDNVMKGYYKRYTDTETTVRDGWLYTGDIGHFDKDGFLVITDRKKDIIVTSGGKNVSPSTIETLLKADRYIEDVLIYGEKKKFLSALIIPDFVTLKEYASYKDIEFKNMKALVNDKRVYLFIQRRIESRQAQLPRFSRIKKFIILDRPLTQDTGELTPTLKIKRKVVTEEYKDMLNGLYYEETN